MKRSQFKSKTQLKSVCLINDATNKLEIATTNLKILFAKTTKYRTFEAILTIESLHATIKIVSEHDWSRLTIDASPKICNLSLIINCPNTKLVNGINLFDLVVDPFDIRNQMSTVRVNNCSIVRTMKAPANDQNEAYVGILSRQSRFVKLWIVSYWNQTKLYQILPEINPSVKYLVNDLTNCLLNFSTKMETLFKCRRQKLWDLNNKLTYFTQKIIPEASSISKITKTTRKDIFTSSIQITTTTIKTVTPTTLTTITSTPIPTTTISDPTKIKSTTIATTIQSSEVLSNTDTSISLHHLFGFSIVTFLIICLAFLLCYINIASFKSFEQSFNSQYHIHAKKKKFKSPNEKPYSNATEPRVEATSSRANESFHSIITVDPANYFNKIPNEKIMRHYQAASYSGDENENKCEQSFHAFDKFGKPRLVSSIQKAKSDLKNKRRLKK